MESPHFFCYNKLTGDIMVLVSEKENYTFDDCNSKMYEFRTEDLIVDFFQSGNRDLYFLCIPREDKKENLEKKILLFIISNII